METGFRPQTESPSAVWSPFEPPAVSIDSGRGRCGMINKVISCETGFLTTSRLSWRGRTNDYRASVHL